jgi:fructan beta-fructosidase
MDPDHVRVALVVSGQVVRRSTGCVSEILGRRVWNVADFKGMTAEIQILDDSEAGWGHLMVDELVEWAAPVPPGKTVAEP